ncbi:MAG: LiaF transmembrane domain-containing protein [Povalibacter sp.]
MAAGIVLIVIGALLMALNLGWGVPLALWNYWPLFLIVPGLVALISPTRHLTRSGGLWLLATGLYCQLAVSDWMGLGWFSAWPIFVIAYGVDIILGRSNGCFQTHSDGPVSHER